MVRPIGFFLAIAALTGCCGGGSPGIIQGAQPDASFAPATPELMMRCGLYGGDGLCRASLDGSTVTHLFDPAYHLIDMTDDGTRVLLGDQDTNLFVANSDGTDLRQIHALDNRNGSAGLSPDGSQIAAVRHADFSLPQRKWVDDDAVYLIDVATLQHQVLPKRADEMVTQLQWEASGRAVQLRMFDGTLSRVTIPGGQRTSLPAYRTPLRSRPSWNRPEYCADTGDQIGVKGFKGDEGLEIITATGHTSDLAVVTGRERVGHDHLPTIDRPYFTPDCGHVVFDFGESVWAVDVATGDVGPITQGRESFVWP